MNTTCFAFLAALLLVGCDVQTNVRSEPGHSTTVALPGGVPGGTVQIAIHEVCYDGVVYLMNSRGGMTSKMALNDMSSPTSPAHAVKCK